MAKKAAAAASAAAAVAAYGGRGVAWWRQSAAEKYNQPLLAGGVAEMAKGIVYERPAAAASASYRKLKANSMKRRRRGEMASAPYGVGGIVMAGKPKIGSGSIVAMKRQWRQ